MPTTEKDAKTTSSTDWRGKHRAGAFGGREFTCEFVATQWLTILKAMSDQLEAVGVKPLIPPSALYGAMVLTVDTVLPANVDLSPPQVAALGTTAITVQRFLHRKRIAAAITSGARHAAAPSSPPPTAQSTAPTAPAQSTPTVAQPELPPEPALEPEYAWRAAAEEIIL